MMNSLERKTFIQDIQKSLKEFIIGEITITESINFTDIFPDYIVQIKNKPFIFACKIDNNDISKERIDKIITEILQEYKKFIYKNFFFD